MFHKPYLYRLAASVGLINLFVILLAATWALHGYRQYREQAEVNTRNLATVLENDLGNVVSRVDVALLALREMHRIHYAEHRRDPSIMNGHIQQLRERLPRVDAIRITDARGILLAGGGVAAPGVADLSDRPHFIRLRDNPADELVISRPQVSRINQKWVIVLARRLTNPEGHFDGMIFAAVSLDSLAQRFADLDLGPRGLATLRDDELRLIVRYPEAGDPGQAIGQQSVAPEMRAQLAAGRTGGTYFSEGGPNYPRHTVSFRHLEGLPLYVTVGLAADDYLAPWRQDSLKLAGIVLLFMAASCYAAVIRYRAWRQQELSSAALARQEALYHELVEDSPMLVVRYRPDTRIIFANAAYAAFLGVPAAEIAGRQRLEFIPDGDERAALLARIASLTPASPVAAHEQHRALTAGGLVRWTQWTDRAFFDADGRLTHLQSVGEDVTEQKRSRDIRAARLRLMEFSVDHSMHELLVATLDEACGLTESPIGFYHFLEADQRTLSLQAWSTRTSREYCKAEGEGRHYDLDMAGVWGDAIRARQPVVHNDYASLPHKRGLPQGHAELLREMVVPVFRKGLIVAILGVGNKARHYTDDDVQAVALLADLAWDFAEAKRLEAELVQMATTDFLTGLANRRQFMTGLAQELARLQRLESHRAAVLMLDLDHFKRINDQYGHSAGDAVLQQFAALVRGELRKIDGVGRLGGEEFAILLLDADLAAAEQFAERLRRRVAETSMLWEGQAIPISVSIGIAQLLATDAQAETALGRADAALYDAKHGGRNQVRVRRA